MPSALLMLLCFDFDKHTILSKNKRSLCNKHLPGCEKFKCVKFSCNTLQSKVGMTFRVDVSHNFMVLER